MERADRLRRDSHDELPLTRSAPWRLESASAAGVLPLVAILFGVAATLSRCWRHDSSELTRPTSLRLKEATMETIDTIDDLEALYEAAVPGSLTKVTPTMTPLYRQWIEASRFVVLTTVGPEGTDASPVKSSLTGSGRPRS